VTDLAEEPERPPLVPRASGKAPHKNAGADSERRVGVVSQERGGAVMGEGWLTKCPYGTSACHRGALNPAHHDSIKGAEVAQP
jgi:hypothetical protein